MSYAASCVLWLGSLVGQAEGCISAIARAMNYFPCPGRVGKPISKGSKVLCYLDSSSPALQVPWPSGATALLRK